MYNSRMQLLTSWKESLTQYTSKELTETNFYNDIDGAALPVGVVIICKKKPFIVTEELYVDEFLGGEIDIVYQRGMRSSAIWKHKSKS